MEQETEQTLSLGSTMTTNDTSFLEKITIQLEKITLFVNNILHKISSVLLLLLMFLTSADVIGRYFFNKPITGTFELTGLALSLMVFFSLGTAQISKSHIEIDFLTNKMNVKVQYGLSAIVSFVLFILISLTSWQLYEYSKRAWLGGELTSELGLPLYIFIAISAVGALSFALTYLLDTLQSFLKVVKK